LNYNRIIKNPITAKTQEIVFKESTLETIDVAFRDWVKNLNIHTQTNKGFKEIPIVWVGETRSFNIQNDIRLRDSDNMLILPLITIERTSIAKRLNKKGTVYAGIPEVDDEKGGTITVARLLNQKKSADYANANSWRRDTNTGIRQVNSAGENEQRVYQTITIPIPVYLDIVYKISVHTEYQQQMNDALAVFGTITGGLNYFTIKNDKLRYEAFMQEEFETDNNIGSLGEDERRYVTSISTNVLGYLISAGKNQEKPKIVIRENAVEIKLQRERVFVGDIPEHTEKYSDQKYRE